MTSIFFATPHPTRLLNVRMLLKKHDGDLKMRRCIGVALKGRMTRIEWDYGSGRTTLRSITCPEAFSRSLVVDRGECVIAS